jgi:hypothetical protein
MNRLCRFPFRVFAQRASASVPALGEKVATRLVDGSVRGQAQKIMPVAAPNRECWPMLAR